MGLGSVSRSIAAVLVLVSGAAVPVAGASATPVTVATRLPSGARFGAPLASSAPLNFDVVLRPRDPDGLATLRCRGVDARLVELPPVPDARSVRPTLRRILGQHRRAHAIAARVGPFTRRAECQPARRAGLGNRRRGAARVRGEHAARHDGPQPGCVQRVERRGRPHAARGQRAGDRRADQRDAAAIIRSTAAAATPAPAAAGCRARSRSGAGCGPDAARRRTDGVPRPSTPWPRATSPPVTCTPTPIRCSTTTTACRRCTRVATPARA